MRGGPVRDCISFGVHRDQRYYTIKEVALDVLGGKSERFVRTLIDKNLIRYINLAEGMSARRDVLIPEDAVDEYFAKRMVAAKSPLSTNAASPSKKRTQESQAQGFLAEIEAHLKR